MDKIKKQYLKEVKTEKGLTEIQANILNHLFKDRFEGYQTKEYITEWAERLKQRRWAFVADNETLKVIIDGLKVYGYELEIVKE